MDGKSAADEARLEDELPLPGDGGDEYEYEGSRKSDDDTNSPPPSSEKSALVSSLCVFVAGKDVALEAPSGPPSIEACGGLSQRSEASTPAMNGLREVVDACRRSSLLFLYENGLRCMHCCCLLLSAVIVCCKRMCMYWIAKEVRERKVQREERSGNE